MIIESRANERVKEARKLQNRKERKETGLHLIESEKLVREAVASGAKIVSCFIEDGFAFVGPASGWQACRHVGEGRMSEPEEILEAMAKRVRREVGPSTMA